MKEPRAGSGRWPLRNAYPYRFDGVSATPSIECTVYERGS